MGKRESSTLSLQGLKNNQVTLEWLNRASRRHATHRQYSSLELIPIHALEKWMCHQGVGTLATQALALLWLDFVKRSNKLLVK